MSNFIVGLLRGLKGKEMAEETPASIEDLLRATIATLQQCDQAIGKCLEVSCKLLEQVRAPLVDPTVPPPVEVTWSPDPGPVMPGATVEYTPTVAVTGGAPVFASAELAPTEELIGTDNAAERVAPSIAQAVSDPTSFASDEFERAANPPQDDPRTPVVDFSRFPEGTHPVPGGIRYEGDTPFNQGYTATINYV